MSCLELLKQLNQDHIIQLYHKSTPQEQQQFQQQVKKLNHTYPGGLRQYYSRARQLLQQSINSVNPYASYKVGVPNGVNIEFSDLNMAQKYQTIGMQQLQNTAFVLVAGGLGERLGYSGIKIGIPMQLLTEKTFLNYYIDYILAFQKKYCPQGIKIPLAIMTSDDTYTKTLELLENNKYFGMDQNQITILKQEKVPALIDSKASFSLTKNKLEIETKPHGHGDIHTLLHQSKLAAQWEKQGKKWIIYFQDTNPLAFRCFTALLGVTKLKDFDFNTVAVPRKPGEAVGAITSLVHKQTGKSLTINVEYNQLQALFKESGGQKVDMSGYSIFPGNTNCFVLKISTYNKILNQTQGLISQFINPKYADSTKTTLKSSARLECMMQDYPKLLDNCDHVGFISVDKGYCFTAAKNDPVSAATKWQSGLAPQSAGSCQGDFYKYNRLMLQQCGALIEIDQAKKLGGIQLQMYPMVSISPFFATCITEMKKKVKSVKIKAKSSLIISSECVLDDVFIDGHAQIKDQGNITLNSTKQDYKVLVPTQGNQSQYLLIRKYKLLK